MKNGERVQLGPFVGIVELTTRDEAMRNWPDWLHIYYEGDMDEPIAYKSFFAKDESPYKALASWLHPSKIMYDMQENKLVKEYVITY